MHELELVLGFLRLKQSLKQKKKILYENRVQGIPCHACYLVCDNFRFQ